MKLVPTTRQISIFSTVTVLGFGFLAIWLVLGNDSYNGFLRPPTFTGALEKHLGDNEDSGWRDRYYREVFTESNRTTDTILTPNLAELCRAITWRPNLYLNCTRISAGLFNQVNEIKNCVRMAIDTGANLILPSSSERDSERLNNFHTDDIAWKRQFRQRWDEEHIMSHLGKACPQMKVLPSDEPPISNATHILIDPKGSPGFKEYLGHFDGTRTFRDYVDKTSSEKGATLNSTISPVVLEIEWTLLVINPENDPTGLDWRAWTEISLLIRPTESHRRLVQKLSEAESLRKDSYIGVHLRVEHDAVGKWWDDLELQVSKNLNSIDVMAKRFREQRGDGKNPFIYVACGDKKGIERFRELAALRGYIVLDKWGVLGNDTESLSKIDKLSFDERGLLDYAVLLNGYFFLGSSFSYTVANMRSDRGRFPGTSFVVDDMAKSFSHLFMPPSGRAHFACCL
ncbi:hypothetical protein TWF225_002076 [Orbilia oligospora]|nr:hypothetical protein TWF225_002076 [Orbilia oligospora]KAF3247051.1 hypothetical protein TWF128_008796 [Orbilia oligospora]KAF3251891.1 hypothetical protein TWF217_007876 [Orbilia oligospora]KAF3290724.1 hypothetical protein TWF132_006796 [Orbilia oligospora]